jgi:hypothetical protein
MLLTMSSSCAAGHFEAANTAALEAMALGVPGAPLEHSKLLWAMDKPHRAIIEMQQVGSWQLTTYSRILVESVLDTTRENDCTNDCIQHVPNLINVWRPSTDRRAAPGQQHVKRCGGEANGLCHGGTAAQAARSRAHAAGKLAGRERAGLPWRHPQCVACSS